MTGHVVAGTLPNHWAKRATNGSQKMQNKAWLTKRFYWIRNGRRLLRGMEGDRSVEWRETAQGDRGRPLRGIEGSRETTQGNGGSPLRGIESSRETTQGNGG